MAVRFSAGRRSFPPFASLLQCFPSRNKMHVSEPGGRETLSIAGKSCRKSLRGLLGMRILPKISRTKQNELQAMAGFGVTDPLADTGSATFSRQKQHGIRASAIAGCTENGPFAPLLTRLSLSNTLLAVTTAKAKGERDAFH